jgi:hypothetical protein
VYRINLFKNATTLARLVPRKQPRTAKVVSQILSNKTIPLANVPQQNIILLHRIHAKAQNNYL